VTNQAQTRFAGRRRGRECALQLLYQLDGREPAGGAGAMDDVISNYWQHVDPEAADNPETARYAEEVTRGVLAHLPEVDGAIEKAAQHWRLERMARVDRNILRLGAYELLFTEVDARIIINEAIELAKAYGTEESGAFVNGVLDRVAEIAST
jgi:N utilization substance protein B